VVKGFYKRRALKTVKWGIIFVIGLSLICFIGVTVAHMVVFSRADYDEYPTDRYLLYEDLNAEEYPRENISIQSGKNKLAAYLYGVGNRQGLIIISPGHRDSSDVKLYEITYFVDAGWMVLSYDLTGCYNSEGASMVGYTQAVRDLNAVLNFVEMDEATAGVPVMLFGHSLGGYASAAVLPAGHDVKAVVVASSFDTPKEQWRYSIEHYTGVLHFPLLPFTDLFIALKYGGEADLSAVDGINAVDIPVLVISGADDEYYGGESQVYAKRGQVRNPNCAFMLMEEPGANGHYDYFLTKEAVAYQRLVKDKAVQGMIDKNQYMEHDKEFMDMLNGFLLAALK
jgi:pimeloyl-ACP methyl ester carboxylesterase